MAASTTGSSVAKKLISCGIPARSAEDACKNANAAANIQKVLEEAGLDNETAVCDKATADLLLLTAVRISPGPNTHECTLLTRPILVNYIMAKKVNKVQVEAACSWARNNRDRDVNVKDFEKSCGVGVVVTAAQIDEAVKAVIHENKEEILDGQYSVASRFTKVVNDKLAWADARAVKDAMDQALVLLLGPKTEANSKPKTKKAVKPTLAAGADEKKPTLFHPGDDDQFSGRDIPAAKNTAEQIKMHMDATGGVCMTRFPPEPNGFLHIGHAKSMFFNFGLAKARGGHTIMRFDDTNPEAEKKVYIDSILENLEWMGHRQLKTTFTSDYFPQLHDLAVKLIKKGKAYVCHQTADEMRKSREVPRTESPWRNRSVDENLRLFERMKRGLFAEGEATLRMKGDMQHSNPQFWDVVAYRIKYVAHPHAGAKWCIYPSYDYTHCIIDSLENITNSCCTLEFEVRRESYYWLLDELDLYKPKVWEYSRLNLEHNVLSKRRLLRLVNEKLVAGWDDPRLLSLNGLRRRGFTSEAINHFCQEIGISRSENCIPNERLENAARWYLDTHARRVFFVTDPLRVVITNFAADKVESVVRPNHPKTKEMGQSEMPLSRVLYIDRADFSLEEVKGYKGLTPKQPTHLKYGPVVHFSRVSKTGRNGQPEEIEVTLDKEAIVKNIKGHLSWVAEPKPGKAPLKVTLRLYDVLFKSKEPMKIKKEEMAALGMKDWVDDLNPKSLVVVEGYAEPSAAACRAGDKVQAERVGYFCCDPDSTSDRLVFNRTCLIREGKKDDEE